VRPLVAALAVAATLFGIAGVAPMIVERRLAALAPGGVELGGLQYNPFTGRLVLTEIRARDAAGRELLSAEHVAARVSPLRLLGRPLTLAQARVTAPRLTLQAAPGLELTELAAGLGGAPAAATSLPIRIDDLAVSGGSVVVEGAGERGAPLVVRDLNVRLGRLTTATVDQDDVAFAVEMGIYGTIAHVTGQPRGAGYTLRVRARGLDVAALARHLPVASLSGLERGRGEIDAELFIVDGHLIASGHVRLVEVALALPGDGRSRLQADQLAAAVDHFDLTSGRGRITRLDLVGPALSLPAEHASAMLAALVARLRDQPDLLVRRVTVTRGALSLEGDAGVRLQGVQLTAHAPERRGDGAWFVTARAGVGADAEASIDGVVARDLAGLDAVARVRRVALRPWGALVGAPGEWDARVSFDGRLRLAMREGEAAVTLAGQAVLADVGAGGRSGFRADRIAVGIRRLQWPGAEAVVDSVVMTRPAFALPAATPWPRLLVTGTVSVVDGELRETVDEPALRDLAVNLAPTGAAGAAHLRLSASVAGGRRLGVDRIVPYDEPTQGAVPLRLLLSALEDAARGRPDTAPRPRVEPDARPVAEPAPRSVPDTAARPAPEPAAPAAMPAVILAP
jgi:hypothetical protein